MSAIGNSPFAFSPATINIAGSTLSFTAATSVPSAVQSTAGQDTYLVSNSGSSVVQLGVASTQAAASTNASTLANSIPLLPGTTQVLVLGRNQWFTGYSASAAVVYVTPGSGI